MTGARNREKDKDDRLFSDISVVQVMATALAAVTSMLLASYIGIAGSVIGTAVASVVSTVAASAYKKFMHDSAEKIKELPIAAIPEGLVKKRGVTSASADGAAAADETEAATESAVGTTDEAVAAGAATGVTAETEAAETAATPSDETEITASTDAAANGSQQAQKKELIAAHQRNVQRGLIAVCVVSALLTVAASGAAIYLLTTGEGLGAKPSIVYVDRSAGSSAHDASYSENSTPGDGGSEAATNGTDTWSDSSASISSNASSNSSSASSSTSSSASSSASSGSGSASSSPEAPETSSSSNSSSASSSTAASSDQSSNTDSAGSTTTR